MACPTFKIIQFGSKNARIGNTSGFPDQNSDEYNLVRLVFFDSLQFSLHYNLVRLAFF